MAYLNLHLKKKLGLCGTTASNNKSDKKNCKKILQHKVDYSWISSLTFRDSHYCSSCSSNIWNWLFLFDRFTLTLVQLNSQILYRHVIYIEYHRWKQWNSTDGNYSFSRFPGAKCKNLFQQVITTTDDWPKLPWSDHTSRRGRLIHVLEYLDTLSIFC